jgi:hypothetical protein
VIRRRLHGPEDQAVTFVELFFDLVFVFAVTEITALTSTDLTGSGVARSVLLFWLIWWAWTQFTWTLNPADTTHNLVRIITLVATGVAFIMATSVSRAFGSEAFWFVIPYLVVRLLGLGLQVRIDLERGRVERGSVAIWASLSLIGLALVLAGAFVDTPGRMPRRARSSLRSVWASRSSSGRRVVGSSGRRRSRTGARAATCSPLGSSSSRSRWSPSGSCHRASRSGCSRSSPSDCWSSRRPKRVSASARDHTTSRRAVSPQATCDRAPCDRALDDAQPATSLKRAPVGSAA